MPIYEYRCKKGHLSEVMQSMTDDPVTACPECGEPVERVFRPVAVHFKGSGFYATDYGRQRPGQDSGGDGKSDSKEAASAKSDGAGGGKSGSGSESKSSSASDSKSGASSD